MYFRISIPYRDLQGIIDFIGNILLFCLRIFILIYNIDVTENKFNIIYSKMNIWFSQPLYRTAPNIILKLACIKSTNATPASTHIVFTAE